MISSRNLAGYPLAVETGQRGFNRRGLLEDLAAALGCSVADLTGQPYLPADRNSAEVLASLPAIRLVLNDFGPMDVPDLTPRRSEELASLAERASGHCGQANYSLAGHAMADLLAESQASALTVAAEERDRAFTAAVTACFVAGVVSSRAATLPAELAGMMHLQQARAAARQQRTDDAYTHLTEAAQLAARVGERNGMQLHFGPTNVAAWRVSIGVELAEGARVYEEATATPIDIDALGSRERSSSMHFDLARVLAQEGGARDGEAIRHLDTADRIAPQRIRSDPIARDLVMTLDRRARRRVWELDSLRNRFGIGGQGPRSVDS